MDSVFSLMGHLPLIRRDTRRERISSWDRTGGNNVFTAIGPNENREIARFAGTGCIRHIWMTLASEADWIAGRTSVEVPVGDFFTGKDNG